MNASLEVLERAKWVRDDVGLCRSAFLGGRTKKKSAKVFRLFSTCVSPFLYFPYVVLALCFRLLALCWTFLLVVPLD